jgi:hypothetical protein
MKKLLSLLLFPIICLAADPTPVARPQPLSYAPSPSATTLTVKWYYYAVYLEQLVAARNQEIATLKDGTGGSVDVTALVTNMAAVLEQQQAINANTKALSDRYHTLNGSVFVKLDALLERPAAVADLSPVITNLGVIDGKVQRLIDRPSNVVITVPNPDDAKIGSRVTLVATADGSPAPGWQWKKDGVDIPGATSSNLVFPSIVAGDTGTYTAVATNEAGSAQASVKINAIP